MSSPNIGNRVLALLTVCLLTAIVPVTASAQEGRGETRRIERRQTPDGVSYGWAVEISRRAGQEVSVTIVHVVPGSKAAQAGLLVGDSVIAVNGRLVGQIASDELSLLLVESPLELTVRRSDGSDASVRLSS